MVVVACLGSIFGFDTDAQTPPPLVRDAKARLDRDYRQGGASRLNVAKDGCVEDARKSRNATQAERCLIYGYAAYLLDNAMTGKMQMPPTPGLLATLRALFSVPRGMLPALPQGYLAAARTMFLPPRTMLAEEITRELWLYHARSSVFEYSRIEASCQRS